MRCFVMFITAVCILFLSIGLLPCDLNLPLLLLWGSCQGKLYCSRDISKLQTTKFPPGKLPRKTSVTFEKFSFPRETVNKSSFPREKVCSVTTALMTQ